MKNEIRSWKWSKPVRWADIVRALLITGKIKDNGYASMMAVRTYIREQEQAGKVRQLERGLYQLAECPPQY